MVCTGYCKLGTPNKHDSSFLTQMRSLLFPWLSWHSSSKPTYSLPTNSYVICILFKLIVVVYKVWRVKGAQAVLTTDVLLKIILLSLHHSCFSYFCWFCFSVWITIVNNCSIKHFWTPWVKMSWCSGLMLFGVPEGIHVINLQQLLPIREFRSKLKELLLIIEENGVLDFSQDRFRA